jgi:hypothetical protein
VQAPGNEDRPAHLVEMRQTASEEANSQNIIKILEYCYQRTIVKEKLPGDPRARPIDNRPQVFNLPHSYKAEFRNSGLLLFGGLSLGLLDDRNIGIGILPDSEQILVDGG